MKNNDKIKLDIISNIDDEIIERNSKKRFELFGKILEKKPNRKMMVAWISLAACFCIMFGVVAALILGGIKQVPIYTGMTVSSTLEQGAAVAEAETDAKTTEIERLAYELTRLSYTGKTLSNTGNNTNVIDDYKNEEFTDDTAALEAEAETDTLNVQGSGTLYYAKPNSDIYITVHISNPDNFEILSFTLNGKKYSSYMFEEGSDMENLILKVNIGDVGGIVEYTIDAIKYVDGTDIKDVRMEGDRIVRVGVESDKLPFAEITKQEVGFNDLKFEVNITDELSLISMVSGKVYAYLYRGNELVESKDVEISGGEIKFEKLEVNTEYRYVIVAQYDALMGEGVESYVLYENSFKTKAPVEFDESIVVTHTGLSFSFIRAEEFSNTKIEKIELWHNGQKVKDLSIDATSVDGLLSNNEYTVKAYYIYKNDTKEITKIFKTEANAVPTVEIVSPTKTQTSVGFGISVTDTDAVGSITKIELLHGNDSPIVADNTAVRSFDGLLSNINYTVRVTYEYDLNDGVGKQTIVKTLDIKTEAKAVPTVELSVDESQTTIEYKLNIVDRDSIFNFKSVYLKDSLGNKLDIVAENDCFTNLNKATKYFVVAEYSYDLNNGEGVKSEEISVASYTDVEFEYISTTVYGESILSGNNITVRVAMKDVSNVEITHLVINGQKIAATKNGEYYYLTFVSNINSGKYQIVIDEICYKIFGDDRSVETNIDTDTSIIILGEIDIASVSLSNGKNYIESGETALGYIDFIGSEGYVIDSMIVNGETVVALTRVTDTRYSFDMIYNSECQIWSVTYTLEGVASKKYFNKKFIFYSYNTAGILEIRTPEQLQNMNPNGNYKLMNDIDMSGFDWTPFNFYGYLDGNGYEIKNLTISKFYNVAKDDYTFKYSCAMFGEVGGVLRNVVLNNLLINIRISSSGLSNLYVGGLAGIITSHSTSNFVNCHVKGDIAVLLDKIDVAYVLIGGLCSYGEDGIFDSCSFDGNITFIYDKNNTEIAIGGITASRGVKINCTQTVNSVVIENGKPI